MDLVLAGRRAGDAGGLSGRRYLRTDQHEPQTQRGTGAGGCRRWTGPAQYFARGIPAVPEARVPVSRAPACAGTAAGYLAAPVGQLRFGDRAHGREGQLPGREHFHGKKTDRNDDQVWHYSKK